MSNTTVIRTPDQRLRVFVSSTLGELAAERSAVRRAIERLRLTPVMFEMGARPHPPRELYRAYLEQSHVFLGIYWQRYGWVAPGESISGLEDEYRLTGERPRLVYLKEPAPEREERLTRLLEELRSDDRTSYRRFTSPDELAELVANDLAVLLSERFEATDSWMHGEARVGAAPPVPLTETVGRSDDIADVVGVLRGGVPLVTLTGVGGVGKTRLALEVVREISRDYPDGVFVVSLASVGDSDRALRTIAERIGARGEGGVVAPQDVLARHLRSQRVLLVLDNLEQIGDFGRVVVGMLERSPGVQVLATSRHALRVRPERERPVAPLRRPDPAAPIGVLGDEPAVRLFVDRASAVVPTFRLDPENAAAVAELCRRLDGLPLAIELAAARARIMSPNALLERLGDRLDVLTTQAGDAPERQRTLRATLDWSYQLLDQHERALFARLSVFSGGFTLDAAEAVCGEGEDDFPGALASLLEKSLVAADRESAGAEPRFEMLETVREYAAERLADTGDAQRYRERHLAWYRRFAEIAQPYLCGPGQQEWTARVDPERANLRLAVETALDLPDHAAIVEIAWDVVVFYFARDAVDEPDRWLRQVSADGPQLDDITDAKLRSLQALTRVHHGDYRDVHQSLLGPLAAFRARAMPFEAAVVLHQLGFVHYRIDGDAERAIAALEESSQLFDSVNHDWGVALAEAMLGSVLAAIGDLEGAERCQQRSLERARHIHSEQQIVQALEQLALIRVLAGRHDEALAFLDQAVPIVRRGRYRTDGSYCLNALAGIAFARDDPRSSAVALAVADTARAQLGIEPWPTVQNFIERTRRDVRSHMSREEFDAILRDSRDLELFETIDRTLQAVET